MTKIFIFAYFGLNIHHSFSFFFYLEWLCLRWPRELNALQLQKTYANRKSTSKSRKHLHQFDSRCCKCSQRKQIKKRAANAHNTTKYIILFALLFFDWLCCDHLQRVCYQINEVVFLICRCFFLFAAG